LGQCQACNTQAYAGCVCVEAKGLGSCDMPFQTEEDPATKEDPDLPEFAFSGISSYAWALPR